MSDPEKESCVGQVQSGSNRESLEDTILRQRVEIIGHVERIDELVRQRDALIEICAEQLEELESYRLPKRGG